MSDFDFDELDKAVNGALGSDTPQDDTPAVPVSPVTPSAPTESVQKDEPIEAASEATSSPRVAPAQRRSSGRFMDVVHPSSDMRSSTSPSVSSRTVTPPSSFTPPATSAKTVDETPLPSDTAADTPVSEDADWSQPLDSPFLPDPKVEKRPLGGTGPAPALTSLDTAIGDLMDAHELDNELPSAIEDAPVAELMLEEPDEPRIEAHAMPDPIDFADATGGEPEAEPTEAPIEVPVEPLAEVEAPSQPAPVAEVTDIPNDQPAGPTSITQQYEERPSTEQASGAIYDTESYHQPLAAAGKKRSGLWTVLWIFLLVVLGAGVGVVFYLFVLPML